MNELLQFIGGYWWLIFPVGAGVAAFVGKVTGSEAREREQKHQHKLERLDAERRLAEAKRGGTPALPAPVTAPASSVRDQLIDLTADHDAITARWLDYELDVAKLIAFPAMSDGRQPLTAAFLRAKRAADSQRPPRVDAPVTPDQLASYRAAVVEYGTTFDIAESDARRVRHAGFAPDERQRLDRAQHLLTVALDESATAAERQVAYKRVRAEVDGLIAISPESVAILETKIGRDLTVAPPAAASPDAAEPSLRTPLDPPEADRRPLS